MSILHPLEGGGDKPDRPKLPIPRWRRPREYDTHSHGPVEKRRVSHACEPCRERKTKCDGDRPLCHHCRMSRIDCYYGDGKRERAKKNLQSLENRTALLEDWIRSIEPHLDSVGKLAVQDILTKSPASTPSRRMSNELADRYDLLPPRSSEIYAGESLVSADVGSAGPLDHITEDVNTASVAYPSGYLGKASETVWMSCVSDELEKVDNDARASSFGKSPFQEATGGADGTKSSRRRVQGASLDDLDISILGRQVDMFGLPPKHVADKLVDSYFATVHPLLPIIYKPVFMTKYSACYASQALRNGNNSRKWLTVLNLVFAISETYLKSELETTDRDERKDLNYFVKSRVLGALDGGSIFEIPDLERVQALGLTGMYLLASIQTNRAWNVVGLAIRLAYGTGLHLRNDSLVDETQNKMRIRVWYCLCCLESNLCLITGRPCAIQDKNCSALCPTALNDEILPSECKDNSTLDDYFLRNRVLTMISTEVLDILYSAQTPKDKSWSQMQDSIRNLSAVLEQWRYSLPSSLNFQSNQPDCVFKRQRLNLALQYYNILMLINRPCLCPMDGRIPNESPESKEFNKLSATSCVSSARTIIHLIVDEPSPTKLIKSSPWWCLFHYLMSAKAIIMLEMVYQAIHTPEHRAVLFADAKDVLRWLRSVSKMNVSLQRYSMELADELKDVAPRVEERSEEYECITLPFVTDYASPPPGSYVSARGEGSSFDIPGNSQGSDQEQYLDFTGAALASWWASPHTSQDLVMADSPRVNPYDYSPNRSQIDISSWLEGGQADG